MFLFLLGLNEVALKMAWLPVLAFGYTLTLRDSHGCAISGSGFVRLLHQVHGSQLTPTVGSITGIVSQTEEARISLVS